jgi:hypothetical protein
MRVWQRKCVRRLPAILAAVAAWVLTGCGTMSDEPRSGEGAPMSSVRVAFTDGFEGDTVVIRVDGREVTQHGPITTRSDVSPPLAWSADIPLERDARGGGSDERRNGIDSRERQGVPAGQRLLLWRKSGTAELAADPVDRMTRDGAGLNEGEEGVFPERR